MSVKTQSRRQAWMRDQIRYSRYFGIDVRPGVKRTLSAKKSIAKAFFGIKNGSRIFRIGQRASITITADPFDMLKLGTKGWDVRRTCLNEVNGSNRDEKHKMIRDEGTFVIRVKKGSRTIERCWGKVVGKDRAILTNMYPYSGSRAFYKDKSYIGQFIRKHFIMLGVENVAGLYNNQDGQLYQLQPNSTLRNVLK